MTSEDKHENNKRFYTFGKESFAHLSLTHLLLILCMHSKKVGARLHKL